MSDKQKQKPKGGGGRTTVLAGLLAIVAAVALWLSDCIPGFGIGAGTKDGEAEQAEQAEQTKEAEPEQPVVDAPPEQPSVAEPTPMKLTIDARGCTIDGADPIDCAALCEDGDRFEGVESVTIDAKHGPHGVVVEVLDCLAAKNLSVAITRE